MSHCSTAFLFWDFERAIQVDNPKSYLTSQDDMVFFESMGTRTIRRAIQFNFDLHVEKCRSKSIDRGHAQAEFAIFRKN